MAATLSLSLQGSNYNTFTAKQQKGLDVPAQSGVGGETWTLGTSKPYNKLRVENYDRETVDIKQAKFERLDFRFDADGGAARIESSKLNRASFTSGAGPSVESLVFGGGAKLARNRAELGEGNDFLEFKAGSKSAGGQFNLGKGEDTAVFGEGTKAGASNRVNLGEDTDKDLVDIKNANDVKGLRIENFGTQDILKIGNVEYKYADVIANNGKIDGVIIKPII